MLNYRGTGTGMAFRVLDPSRTTHPHARRARPESSDLGLCRTHLSLSALTVWHGHGGGKRLVLASFAILNTNLHGRYGLRTQKSIKFCALIEHVRGNGGPQSGSYNGPG